MLQLRQPNGLRVAFTPLTLDVRLLHLIERRRRAEVLPEHTKFVVPIASFVDLVRYGSAIVSDVHLDLALFVVVWCRRLVGVKHFSNGVQSVRSQCSLVFIHFQPAAVSTMAFLNSIARLTDS